jgi:hypothetical protein
MAELKNCFETLIQLFYKWQRYISDHYSRECKPIAARNMGRQANADMGHVRQQQSSAGMMAVSSRSSKSQKTSLLVDVVVQMS